MPRKSDATQNLYPSAAEFQVVNRPLSFPDGLPEEFWNYVKNLLDSYLPLIPADHVIGLTTNLSLTDIPPGTLGQVLTTVDDGGLKAEWADPATIAVGTGSEGDVLTTHDPGTGPEAVWLPPTPHDVGGITFDVLGDGEGDCRVPFYDNGDVGIDVWQVNDYLPGGTTWTLKVDGVTVASNGSLTPFTAASGSVLTLTCSGTGGDGSTPVGQLLLSYKAVTTL